MNPLVGKTIERVWLASDNQAIKFDVKGEDPVIARTDGDCCSYSWVEALDTPEYLIGTVVEVKDIDMPDVGQEPRHQEYVQYYGCRITTDKGSCVIDYRNESNGYYGGDLVWGDRFYGGVFEQNVSEEEWKEVTG